MSSLTIHILIGIGLSVLWALLLPVVARLLRRDSDPQAFLVPAIPALLLTTLFGTGIVNIFLSLMQVGALAGLAIVAGTAVVVTVVARVSWSLFGPRAETAPAPADWVAPASAV